MRLGKVLWAIIGIKLFVMFAILKLFFFPDTIKNESRNQGIDKSEYVANEFLERVPVRLNVQYSHTVITNKPKFNIYD